MRPETEKELADVIGNATGPLCLLGGGTRGGGTSGTQLSLSGLRGITLYEPGSLTMRARAGTPVAEIEATLATADQRLAFEPMDHRGLLGSAGAPTIGGVVAANVSGPRRIQVGACRDFVLGVRFVDGIGRILKNGGRVMKNVTGYDLVKLLCGSHGTIGALSEVAFKVLPTVETEATVLIDGLSDVTAVEAMSAALGAPFEVSGAAHARAGRNGPPVTMLRLEGFEGSVRYRSGKLQNLLARFGEITVDCDPEQSASLWRDVRDVAGFHGGEGDIWRISVKPSDGPLVARNLGDAEVLFDWGGGLVWARVAAGTDLRALLVQIKGHATLVRASDATRARLGVFQPEPGPLAAISRGLREKFDPRALLNPGLMDPIAS
ncbi:MAG: FAD-binding protein [Halocynthiibacter sp.]